MSTVLSSVISKYRLFSCCSSPGHMKLLHVDVQPIGVRVLATPYKRTRIRMETHIYCMCMSFVIHQRCMRLRLRGGTCSLRPCRLH